MMRKLVYVSVGLLIILAAVSVNDSFTSTKYGDAVDSFCLDSNPFSSDCSLCHLSGDYKARTPEMNAYLAGDLCSFCPNDSSCSGSGCTDADGDGFYAANGCGTAVDCNDKDPMINPGEIEFCNDGKDNDCNNAIDMQDRACGVITCTDGDGDGFSSNGGDCGPADCNDNDFDIFPGAVDICNDGIDQDCSGKDRTKGKGCKIATGNSTTRGKEGKGRTCSDGLDNDGDGFTDCFDTGCSNNRACR